MMRASAGPSDWQRALRLSTGYWAVLGILLTLRSIVVGTPRELQPLVTAIRLVDVTVGCIGCILIWLAMRRLRSPFGYRVAAGGGLTLVVTFLFALCVNIVPTWIFGVERGASLETAVALPVGGNRLGAHELLLETLEWLPLFMAWSGIAFGLLYSLDVREREREVQKLQILSHQAQLRALRYQIDPHFLFNALNSVATLVLDRRNEIAETMLLHLSAYFRHTLSLDPTDDITLAHEIELQNQYLEIERRRFDAPLDLGLDVPAPLLSALVPSFILHPLVENAIKHGQSGWPESAPGVAIRARAHGRWLDLTVRNNAGAGPTAAPSTGTGLKNVRERLRLRFGSDHSFETACDDTAFVVRLRLPLHFSDREG